MTTTRPAAARTPWALVLGLVLLVAVVAAVVVLSLAVGAGPAGPAEAVDALFGRAGEYHWIVLGLRVPRTLLGLLVGAALGAAGVLMQALTRNPLADPGLLGVNAGAAAAIATAIAFLAVRDVREYVWFAFLGAAVISVAVYVIGSQGRAEASPVRLAVAGAAVTAALTGYTSAVVLYSEETFDDFRFWQVGSLSGRDMGTLGQILPFVVAGLLLALALTRPLNALALGPDVARSLGVNLTVTRLLSTVAITVLCGAATAAAGPIAFVGLTVPHVARMIVGVDLRWLMPYAVLLAAVLVLGSDVLGRVLAGQGELEVGIVTAFVGAPFFIALVRRRRVARL